MDGDPLLQMFNRLLTADEPEKLRRRMLKIARLVPTCESPTLLLQSQHFFSELGLRLLEGEDELLADTATELMLIGLEPAVLIARLDPDTASALTSIQLGCIRNGLVERLIERAAALLGALEKNCRSFASLQQSLREIDSLRGSLQLQKKKLEDDEVLMVLQGTKAIMDLQPIDQVPEASASANISLIRAPSEDNEPKELTDISEVGARNDNEIQDELSELALDIYHAQSLVRSQECQKYQDVERITRDLSKLEEARASLLNHRKDVQKERGLVLHSMELILSVLERLFGMRTPGSNSNMLLASCVHLQLGDLIVFMARLVVDNILPELASPLMRLLCSLLHTTSLYSVLDEFEFSTSPALDLPLRPTSSYFLENNEGVFTKMGTTKTNQKETGRRKVKLNIIGTDEMMKNRPSKEQSQTRQKQQQVPITFDTRLSATPIVPSSPLHLSRYAVAMVGTCQVPQKEGRSYQALIKNVRRRVAIDRLVGGATALTGGVPLDGNASDDNSDFLDEDTESEENLNDASAVLTGKTEPLTNIPTALPYIQYPIPTSMGPQVTFLKPLMEGHLLPKFISYCANKIHQLASGTAKDSLAFSKSVLYCNKRIENIEPALRNSLYCCLAILAMQVSIYQLRELLPSDQSLDTVSTASNIVEALGNDALFGMVLNVSEAVDEILQRISRESSLGLEDYLTWPVRNACFACYYWLVLMVRRLGADPTRIIFTLSSRQARALMEAQRLFESSSTTNNIRSALGLDTDAMRWAEGRAMQLQDQTTRIKNRAVEVFRGVSDVLLQASACLITHSNILEEWAIYKQTEPECIRRFAQAIDLHNELYSILSTRALIGDQIVQIGPGYLSREAQAYVVVDEDEEEERGKGTIRRQGDPCIPSLFVTRQLCSTKVIGSIILFVDYLSCNLTLGQARTRMLTLMGLVLQRLYEADTHHTTVPLLFSGLQALLAMIDLIRSATSNDALQGIKDIYLRILEDIYDIPIHGDSDLLGSLYRKVLLNLFSPGLIVARRSQLMSDCMKELERVYVDMASGPVVLARPSLVAEDHMHVYDENMVPLAVVESRRPQVPEAATVAPTVAATATVIASNPPSTDDIKSSDAHDTLTSLLPTTVGVFTAAHNALLQENMPALIAKFGLQNAILEMTALLNYDYTEDQVRVQWEELEGKTGKTGAFTEEEDGIIREAFATMLDIRLLSVRLHRSTNTVLKRAEDLGLIERRRKTRY
ncbi:hypothetical protein GMRT_15779 [Giardia muris]|uniref:Uncharacterized protein n=1 Tax=Giardia muris TaxID=5742 RepID=A0A4Z1T548_GIAMU|nr:hypothetical protein GMRT_15779 [Giardia muris]|eukprot:TNJ29133.1 hypothetical protein GMRT_15779 [Giardia muris]